MEENFVSYEIDLVLRKLGFDEECLGIYYGDGILSYDYDPEMYSSSLPAPLYQQVLKWLREKHDIFVEVNIKHRNLKRYFFYSISYDNNSYEGYSEVLDVWLGLGVEENEIYHVYVTYKQALEQGILEALKLVESDDDKEAKELFIKHWNIATNNKPIDELTLQNMQYCIDAIKEGLTKNK